MVAVYTVQPVRGPQHDLQHIISDCEVVEKQQGEALTRTSQLS